VSEETGRTKMMKENDNHNKAENNAETAICWEKLKRPILYSVGN